jgi:GMP synthase-like glutamine amidotransferase
MPPITKFGLLNCDEVAAPLGATYGEYPAMFEALLRASGHTFEHVPFRAYAGEMPASIEVCDAWLITGSRHSVYEDLPWIHALEAFVRELHAARRKGVGICFGHQLIGLAMGGRTELARAGWGLGRHEVEVIEQATWMRPPRSQFAAYVVHQDQVTELPVGARRLASNAHCVNWMFVLDACLLGIQGHPEFVRDFARAVTANKTGRAPTAVLDAALSSFDKPVDADLIAQWIAGFLTSPN